MSVCSTSPSKPQYADANTNTCRACNQACSACSGPNPLGNCTGCSASSGTSYFLDALAKSCVLSCPPGLWNYVPTLSCVPCTGNCKTCGALQNQCLSCNSGSFLQGTQCVAVCTTVGQYGDTTQNACLPCSPACTSCTGATAYNCQSCATFYYFFQQNSTCALTCPSVTTPI